VAKTSAPTKPVIGPDDENEIKWEVAGSAAPRARLTKPVEGTSLNFVGQKPIQRTTLLHPNLPLTKTKEDSPTNWKGIPPLPAATVVGVLSDDDVIDVD
jgi:hypothetical protein